MSERRILFRTLILALSVLVVAFALLFHFVDIQWMKTGADVVNSARTVIATGVMIALGIGVYVARRKNN